MCVFTRQFRCIWIKQGQFRHNRIPNCSDEISGDSVWAFFSLYKTTIAHNFTHAFDQYWHNTVRVLQTEHTISIRIKCVVEFCLSLHCHFALHFAHLCLFLYMYERHGAAMYVDVVSPTHVRVVFCMQHAQWIWIVCIINDNISESLVAALFYQIVSTSITEVNCLFIYSI